jgi:hypothetical protein
MKCVYHILLISLELTYSVITYELLKHMICTCIDDRMSVSVMKLK